MKLLFLAFFSLWSLSTSAQNLVRRGHIPVYPRPSLNNDIVSQAIGELRVKCGLLMEELRASSPSDEIEPGGLVSFPTGDSRVQNGKVTKITEEKITLSFIANGNILPYEKFHGDKSGLLSFTFRMLFLTNYFLYGTPTESSKKQ